MKIKIYRESYRTGVSELSVKGQLLFLVSHNYSTLPLHCVAAIDRQYINRWAWLCSSKTLLTKIVGMDIMASSYADCWYRTLEELFKGSYLLATNLNFSSIVMRYVLMSSQYYLWNWIFTILLDFIELC